MHLFAVASSLRLALRGSGAGLGTAGFLGGKVLGKGTQKGYKGVSFSRFFWFLKWLQRVLVRFFSSLE